MKFTQKGKKVRLTGKSRGLKQFASHLVSVKSKLPLPVYSELVSVIDDIARQANDLSFKHGEIEFALSDNAKHLAGVAVLKQHEIGLNRVEVFVLNRLSGQVKKASRNFDDPWYHVWLKV